MRIPSSINKEEGRIMEGSEDIESIVVVIASSPFPRDRLTDYDWDQNCPHSLSRREKKHLSDRHFAPAEQGESKTGRRPRPSLFGRPRPPMAKAPKEGSDANRQSERASGLELSLPFGRFSVGGLL